jgi:hypothetical protein
MFFSDFKMNTTPVREGGDLVFTPVPFRARRGSSLVEMLAAIIVLMFVLMAMGSMFLLSRTAMYSKEDETANEIALRFLEEQEGKPFSTFDNLGAVTSTGFGGNKYTATASVVSRDSFSATVRVEVEWGAAVGGKRKTVTLERVISAGGHRNVGEL